MRASRGGLRPSAWDGDWHGTPRSWRRAGRSACRSRGYRALTGRLSIRSRYNRRPCRHRPPTHRIPRRGAATRAPGGSRRAPARGAGVADVGRRRRRDGFLHRLFPPAPPLPGRPDPLAGFDRSGPLRPVRERLFLLRQAPARVARLRARCLPRLHRRPRSTASSAFSSCIGTFVLFGALIAAGGSAGSARRCSAPRPGLLGFVLAIAFIVYPVLRGRTSRPIRSEPGQTVRHLVRLQAVYQAGLGLPRRVVRRLPAATPDPAEQRRSDAAGERPLARMHRARDLLPSVGVDTESIGRRRTRWSPSLTEARARRDTYAAPSPVRETVPRCLPSGPSGSRTLRTGADGRLLHAPRSAAVRGHGRERRARGGLRRVRRRARAPRRSIASRAPARR